MKGKMLILLAVICSLSSCVKEELIGPSEKEGLPVTIGVSMSALEATTKADTKSSATDDEATINDGFILVFKKADVNADPNECIGYAKVEPTDDIKGEGVTVNTITGHVRFVGIANADGDLSQKLVDAFAGTTKGDYAALKAMTSSQLLDDPTKLIKVGTKDEELKLPPTNEKINIEVVQLVARVIINMTPKGEDGENWKFEMSEYSVAAICTQSELLLSEYVRDASYSYNTKQNHTGKLLSSGVPGNQLSFYSYEKETSKSPISVKVKGNLVRTDEGHFESIPKEYSFDLNPVEKDLSVTNGFVHGYAYVITGNIEAKKPGISLLVKVVPMNEVPLNVGYGGNETWN